MFIKIASLAGVNSLQASISSRAYTNKYKSVGLYPLSQDIQSSVYIIKTNIRSKTDSDNLYNSGLKLSKEIIIPSNVFPYKKVKRFIIKPNWTQTNLKDCKCRNKVGIDQEILGVHTDLSFMEGFIKGIHIAGNKSIFIRECFRPTNWEKIGYKDWADKNSFDLRDLSSKPIWEQPEGAINFVKVPNGVVFKEIGFMSPVNEPGTFLVNIAKLKSHGMGITASVKNLQGTCTHTFHLFCTRYDQVRTSCDKRYHPYFHDDFEKHIESLYAQHVAQKIPRWDRPGPDGGIWMEQWANRMLDALSVTKPGINIVEGIYAHEGDGLGGGPEGKGKDIMANIVIFGLDPLRVDIIAHWIAGHEPGNFGLFHLAIQRGMLDVLDPHDIPLYLWENGKATRIELESVKRVPLLTYYLARDYGRGHEPKYHLVDEECDYAMWKAKYGLS
jgi:uncharacterized protein (DUF362 family)